MIPPQVLSVQRDASDPSVSAWVAANAGSGKTHVLAQRVIRLLLNGTSPEKILCLTYTKAAAANMANRVFETLAKWTPLTDAELDDAILTIEGRRPDARRRLRARRMFAEALDTPGGLKVQTIHAFCTRLLHQFPFEADVAARFEVLEERTQTELIEGLRMAVLLQAAAKPESALGRALASAITMSADQTFADVINDALMKRDELTAWLTAAGGVDGAMAELSRALGVEADETSESIDLEIIEGPLLPPSEWASVAAICKASSTNDQKQCAKFLAALAETGNARVDAYLSIFLTDKFEQRKSVVTGALAKQNPALADRLANEQVRVFQLFNRQHAVATRERTAALVTIATEVITRYRAEKDRRGLLDYDDLIDRTTALLANERAQWVHYKLDRGIDHVLIDEAQDTSPKQWQIVQHLVAEFSSGQGAREVPRSIFAVGDEKQSIFSFQGAEPDEFAEQRKFYARAYRDAELEFAELKFLYSFRSAPTVLGAVDAVFSQPQAFQGLTNDPVPTVHAAVRAQSPGLVELWPLIEPDEKREIEGWDAPFDEATETSPRVKLAQRIARRVKASIGREPVGDGNDRRAARAGDVLVLVRQRGPLFEAIIRALKDAHVAVAGADRMVLTEHIAVMDLIALADALLLPHDDLALASVLKSPLFGLDEDQLFALAWNRDGTLREALRAKTDEVFVKANAQLERYTDWAQGSPFTFYARVLGADRGRARFFARLGPEAADALDEFLEHALMYERHEAPTLQGFVAWLRASVSQVKRDMDIARDEVRVMTVHGAKGLEAPIVILADTTGAPKGSHEPRLLALPAQNAAPGTPDRIVWAARKADDVGPITDARTLAAQDAVNESRRLLYVAMTRAADKLVVAGARGERRLPEGCWYELVESALKPDAIETPAEDGDDVVLRWRKGDEDAVPVAAVAPPTPVTHAVPGWLKQPAPPEKVPIRTIAPSTAAGRDTGNAQARARGRIVHRLLQALPALSPETREAAARAHLARAGLADETAVREVLGVLNDARFARLFAAGSRAEVPIVGHVIHDGKKLTVSGQVDRLAVTESEVLIADFKSGHAPREAMHIPHDYVSQLALYAGVLKALYPAHGMRAALVWTAGPALTELSADALSTALSRLADR